MGRTWPLLALLALALPATAYAEDGTAGHVAGTVTAAWQTDTWNGSVSMQLDPGTAARDAAVARIRSVDHVRAANEFNTQGGHVTALQSVRSTSFPCDDGTSATSSSTFGAITDADTPMFVDRPFLDLLRSKGTINVAPRRDNYGDPLPETGRDFFPVPGQAAVHNVGGSCIPDNSSTEDTTAAIFGTDTEVAVPFGVPIYLESFDMPLRPQGSTWRAKGTIEDRVLGGLPIKVDYDIQMVGPPRSWVGICKVPVDADLRKARTAKAAVAVVKKAGFPKARFAGTQKTRYHHAGRYFVDEKFTSSGEASCFQGRPKVFLAKRV